MVREAGTGAGACPMVWCKTEDLDLPLQSQNGRVCGKKFSVYSAKQKGERPENDLAFKQREGVLLVD